MRPVKWEYALLYISDEQPARRWILFSHEQDAASLERYAPCATAHTATSIHFDPQKVHTTWILGTLGDGGVGAGRNVARVDSLEAACLYLKRELADDGRQVAVVLPPRA